MHDDNDDLVQLTKEIDINLMGPIRMTKKFLPHLKAKKTAAIMNVSSGLAFVPLTISPVYSATKAGLAFVHAGASDPAQEHERQRFRTGASGHRHATLHG